MARCNWIPKSAATEPRVYKWCALRCAVVTLRCLAAAVSRRTRQRLATTIEVAVEPPQDVSEVKLAQLRARYHLPTASVAELLDFVDESGAGDTKRSYETLLAGSYVSPTGLPTV